MRDYGIQALSWPIPRDSMILDTNVIYAGFANNDDPDRILHAQWILEEHPSVLLLPTVVVVEAWGLLVGRDGDRDAGMKLLSWVNTPGRTILLPHPNPHLDGIHTIMTDIPVDCVDAMLVELSRDIIDHCALRIPIATFDTRDFLILSRKHGLNLPIYDMSVLQPYDV